MTFFFSFPLSFFFFRKLVVVLVLLFFLSFGLVRHVLQGKNNTINSWVDMFPFHFLRSGLMICANLGNWVCLGQFGLQVHDSRCLELVFEACSSLSLESQSAVEWEPCEGSKIIFPMCSSYFNGLLNETPNFFAFVEEVCNAVSV